MEILTLFALAVGLCFDTFAVSVSSGLIKKDITFTQALRIASVLAIFQALMPAVGWFLGVSIKGFVEPVDHWAAFIMLAILGGKMIIESFDDSDSRDFDPLKFKIMTGMAIATSIDALIVGVSFGMFCVNPWLAIAIIGFVTFLASIIGIYFGKKTGEHFGKKVEILGGLILIIIGLKILIEHLVGA